MPDICMCASAKCPKATSCYRHMASGTQPDEFRQAYFALGQEGSPSEDEACLLFLPRTPLVAALHDDSFSGDAMMRKPDHATLQHAMGIIRAEYYRLTQAHAALPAAWHGGATTQHHRYNAAAQACARIHTYLYEECCRITGIRPMDRSEVPAFNRRHPDLAALPAQNSEAAP